MSGKVCVTGGAGFIGSNLSDFLVHNGYGITCFDNLSTGNAANIENLQKKENFEFVKGDLRNLKLLKNIFQDIDFVFHQAALPSVERSIKDPVTFNEVNVDGTLNVLKAALDCGVKKVIFASSSSVYGDTPTLPKIETMKPMPKSPYAVTKLCGEYYMRVFYEVYGLQTVSLRYFNVYGPKQNPKSEYAAVIPKFIFNALRNKPLSIYGDGKQTRDFTYIEDVVQANMLAMKKRRCSGKVLNIANGTKTSINELADTIIRLTNSGSKVLYAAPRPGDIKHSLADISLAKKVLNFTPKVGLEEGLEKSINFFRHDS